MKLVMRNWKWLAGLVTAGLICATYLLAQIQTVPTSVETQSPDTGTVKVTSPNEVEAADSALLIEAVNAGDTKAALEILHAHGVAEETVLSMATRLGKAPARVQLKEPFLKASFAELSVVGKATKEQVRSQAAAVPEYQRPILVVRRLNGGRIEKYDGDLSECLLPPIAVLNVRLDDPRLIRFIRWYDRYAELLHSVVLNGENLNNAKLDVENYGQANRTLNALFQLIKARKPDAFVWLGVVKQDVGTDEAWLKAMTFKPDGLQISNLRQFHSPFAATRRRYAEIVGVDTPMMVAGFYGYKDALQEKGNLLLVALNNKDTRAREAMENAAKSELGNIGAAVGQELVRLEADLRSQGYRGLSAHWLLHAALANSDKAAKIDKSDLLNPQAGLLETYYSAKDYTRLYTLASEMVANSAPGDMDWTAGRLYEAIALLSQTPPRTNEAIAALDELLAFDFKNRPGRDHYILCAVQRRIQAAFLAGDKNKAWELAKWVQNREFRKDLKSDFLKMHEIFLTQPTSPSK